MVPSAEFTATVSNFNSDITQKLLDMRSEIFSRISELNTQTMDVVAQKANQDDFRQLIEEKVDMSVMKTYFNQKLGLAEFDSLKVIVERMHSELVQKATERELENLADYIKN